MRRHLGNGVDTLRPVAALGGDREPGHCARCRSTLRTSARPVRAYIQIRVEA